MQESSAEKPSQANGIKTKSIRGVVILISRSIFLQPVSIIGLFLLTKFLSVVEIGLFIAVSEIVGILGYFSDVGLAASLVQKKSNPTEKELRSIFTFQQILVLSLILIVVLISPYIQKTYSLSESGIFLLYSLLLSFFLASLKTIPSIMVERQLKFESLIVTEILETFVFYILAVYLAWKGFGSSAYAFAVVARSIVGVMAIYKINPWKIGLELDLNSLKPLLRYGFGFQLNTLLAVIKDRFSNLLLWRIIGDYGLGIIGTSQTWSQKPMRLIVDSVTRVLFPGISRLQHDMELTKRAIEKTLLFISTGVFPSTIGIIMISPWLIHLIPNYSKWEPAIFSLTIFCLSSAISSISAPIGTILNALGKIKVNLLMMVVWTIMTWTLTPYLATIYGYNGVAISHFAISLTSIFLILFVKKITKFSLTKAILTPTLSTAIMYISGSTLLNLIDKSWANLVLVIIVSAATYAASLILISGKQYLQEIIEFTNHVKK